MNIGRETLQRDFGALEEDIQIKDDPIEEDKFLRLATNNQQTRKYTVQTESAENFPDETEGSASQDGASNL